MTQRAEVREVWLLRHAESVANAGGRTVEAGTYSLSALGFRQADQLASALTMEPDVVVLSPYTRARQTVDPFLKMHRALPVEVWPVQEVQYLDPTLCVGTTQEERRAMSIAYWEKADADYAAPNAESFVVFIGRAQAAIRRLSSRSERRTLMVCHGQFMSAVAWLVLTRPAQIDTLAMRRFYQFIHGYAVPNCAILPLYIHPTGAISVGGLHVPAGVDTDALHVARSGLAGL